MAFSKQILESNIICIKPQQLIKNSYDKVWQKPELVNLGCGDTQGGSSATWEDASGIMS